MPETLRQQLEESTSSPTTSAAPTTSVPGSTPSAGPVPAPTEEGPAPSFDASVLSDLVDGIGKLNSVLEGESSTAAEPAGPLVLDGDQFGALGIGLALVVALLAALLVTAVRR